MESTQPPFNAVPTNIITGFLGVGKTTAILNLIRNKPEGERWAILVNEFGEIGVDGSLYYGQSGDNQQVYIREVAGGCMCCAAGLPMQIALNQLLVRAKPDRLLIEPTGLGHPKEVLQILSSEHYHKALSLHKTITLVDARKLSDERYTSHDTFNQQISVADIVIGNKLDLYGEEEKGNLIAYVKEQGQPHANVAFTQHGDLDISILHGATHSLPEPHHHHSGEVTPTAADLPMPESGFIKAENEGEKFNSVGWRFAPSKVFDYQKLFCLFSGLKVERLKAVFITDKGVFGYNLTADALTEIELDDCVESRIEIISEGVFNELDEQLLACVVP